MILEDGNECHYTLRQCITACNGSYPNQRSIEIGNSYQAISPSILPHIQQLLNFFRYARLPSDGKIQFIEDERRRTAVARDFIIKARRKELMVAVAKGKITPKEAVDELAKLLGVH